MLAPRDRTLLLQSLRPPPGYRLDLAVGTSFTLDLLAMLTVPLGFTFSEWEDEAGQTSLDPVSLLHALRENARRMHLFCQAGCIRAAGSGQPLFAALEPAVIEVQAPRPDGLFHPKVWALRFTAPDEQPQYRVLVASRNLTVDRSWDTLLVLEGQGTGRTNRVRDSQPLGDFVAALPDLAVRPVEEERRAAITALADELQRVRFDPPEPFKSITFHPLGIPGYEDSWPLAGGGFWCLIISPFLTDKLVGEVLDECRAFDPRHASVEIISRAESLQALQPHLLAELDACWTLSDAADPEEEGDPGEVAAAPAEGSEELEGSLTGLHAKLVILHRGHQAHVFTGSANATTPAYERNVEFMVEMVGGRGLCGIPALMGSKDGEKGKLRDLLEAWEPIELPVDEERQLREELDHRLAKARLALGGAELSLAAAEHDSGADSYEVLFDLVLSGALPSVLDGIDLRCWPATQVIHKAVPLVGDGELARFAGLPLVELTAFLNIELIAREGGVTASSRMARHLPLTGAPGDREEQLLRAILKDRETVLRLLWLLLERDDPGALPAVLGQGGGPQDRRGGLGGMPLLEGLIRSVARDPASLKSIQKLVDDLRRSEEGAALLPDGFDAIWEPVLAAHRELQG